MARPTGGLYRPGGSGPGPRMWTSQSGSDKIFFSESAQLVLQNPENLGSQHTVRGLSHWERLMDRKNYESPWLIFLMRLYQM